MADIDNDDDVIITLQIPPTKNLSELKRHNKKILPQTIVIDSDESDIEEVYIVSIDVSKNHQNQSALASYENFFKGDDLPFTTEPHSTYLTPMIERDYSLLDLDFSLLSNILDDKKVSPMQPTNMNASVVSPLQDVCDQLIVDSTDVSLDIYDNLIVQNTNGLDNAQSHLSLQTRANIAICDIPDQNTTIDTSIIFDHSNLKPTLNKHKRKLNLKSSTNSLSDKELTTKKDIYESSISPLGLPILHIKKKRLINDVTLSSSSNNSPAKFGTLFTALSSLDRTETEDKCYACSVVLRMQELSFCISGHACCGTCLQLEVKQLLACGKKGTLKCNYSNCHSYYLVSQLKNSLPIMVVEILEEKLDHEYYENATKLIYNSSKYSDTSEDTDKKGVPVDVLKDSDVRIEMPESWEPMSKDKEYCFIDIPATSVDYDYVSNIFHESMSREYSSITRVRRLQNPVLWQFYSVKKLQMEKSAQSSLCELFLFHGTHGDVVEAICRSNFDWRLCGAHGTVYGQGSYFAKDATYSHMYTDNPGNQAQFQKLKIVKKNTSTNQQQNTFFNAPIPKPAHTNSAIAGYPLPTYGGLNLVTDNANAASSADTSCTQNMKSCRFDKLTKLSSYLRQQNIQHHLKAAQIPLPTGLPNSLVQDSPQVLPILVQPPSYFIYNNAGSIVGNSQQVNPIKNFNAGSLFGGSQQGSSTGDCQSANLLGNLQQGNVLAQQGNIQQINILTQQGNIQQGNVLAPGNIQQGNVLAPGNIQQGNVLAQGNIQHGNTLTQINIQQGNTLVHQANTQKVNIQQGNNLGLQGNIQQGNSLAPQGNIQQGSIPQGNVMAKQGNILGQQGNIQQGNVLAQQRNRQLGDLFGNSHHINLMANYQINNLGGSVQGNLSVSSNKADSVINTQVSCINISCSSQGHSMNNSNNGNFIMNSQNLNSSQVGNLKQNSQDISGLQMGSSIFNFNGPSSPQIQIPLGASQILGNGAPKVIISVPPSIGNPKITNNPQMIVNPINYSQLMSNTKSLNHLFSGSNMAALTNSHSSNSKITRGTDPAKNWLLDGQQTHSHKMFLARVLVGKFTLGKNSYRKPPPLDVNDQYGACYDSCVNDLNNPSIYVVFNSSQCYPEYIIEYTTTTEKNYV